jgi:hypothetical protein
MAKGTKTKADQACETCRSLKIRCLPSSQADTCIKCANSQKHCVFLERAPRQPQRQHKPKHSSKARIVALESKIDELIAFATQSNSNKKKEALERDAGPVGHGLLTPSTSSGQTERDSPSSSGSSKDTSLCPFGRPFPSWAGYPRLNGIPCPQILFECGLSFDAAEDSLRRFRTMTSNFPFFVLPQHITALMMCKEQPFTLLAGLAAATRDKTLQKTLGHRFKTCALHAIMIDNERSLDLLNGVLIYLAW